jgi:hypothetical protein
VCCTGLRASWSELAYVAGHCVLHAPETDSRQSPFSCAWPVVAWAVVISAAGRPRKQIVIWRAGCSSRRARRKCREKGVSFSELAS